MTFVRVAVPVPSSAGGLFSYSTPPGLSIEAGHLAMVPFGPRVLPGIVARIDRDPPEIATRDLLGTIRDAPALSRERVDVALWMATHYHASPFDCLSLFLPPGWQQAIVKDAGSAGASSRWRLAWPAPPVTDDMLLAPAPSIGNVAEAVGGGKRAAALSFLIASGPAPAVRVAAAAGCTLTTLRQMVSKGLLVPVESGDAETRRHGDAETRRRGEGRGEGKAESTGGIEALAGNGRVGTTRPPMSIVLNEQQAAVYAPIAEALSARTHRVFLLHGVTGSGKTHVYLKTIQSTVAAGRKAIVLVSEIAQTPEALDRYSELFPGRVAVLHSGLAGAERWRLWGAVAEGRYDVVLGPRSALFAPVPQVGLIVMDEEHEPSYKHEERAPRYHARDVAVALAERFGSVVVLGSATPDVGSYYRAQRGRYQLLSLPDRYAGPSTHGWSTGQMPAVKVVDMREELKAGSVSIISRALREGLEQTLAEGRQSILFLNRRGGATSVVCRDCGEVLKCRRCDVPMVYHLEFNELVCHRCNRRRSLPERCPACRGKRISYFGAGTERVVAEVQKLFPSARVLRWDGDVTGLRGAHQRLHRQFREHEADVLVGTQMVAKALDFPLVTLVGVILADITLHLPDFRSAERTFQLLAQVAGRAGRGVAPGSVILQTYSPDHYSVVAASHHNYAEFYERELAFRRAHSYPPFRRLARLTFSGTGETRSRVEALEMRKRLQQRVDEEGIPDLDLMGPAPCFHARLRGKYRWQIVLAGEGLWGLIAGLVLPPGWALDVDPVSLL